MVVLRFKVAKNVKDSLEGFSSVCYPVGQPPHHLMDCLISNEYPISSVSSVLFIEDELTKIIHHQTSNV